MLKAWSITKRRLGEQGFSPVEILLAVTIFGMMVTGLIGALVYGRQSTNDAGNHARATMLADEGIEAVRTLRSAAYSNLVNGTYGLAQTSNQWALSGTSDTSDIFTRQITIASGSANRKTITCTVSWSQLGSSSTVTVISQLTNWAAIASWANPSIQASLAYQTGAGGLKVAVQGNYAYLLRSAAPNFVVFDISNPGSPTVVRTLTLTGTLNRIAVSGNYAYIATSSDTGELQIVNITTPASASLVGTYDAAGAADGRGIAVVGTTAYLSRSNNASNNEFVVVNVATPSAPARLGGYNNNIIMYDVYVVNNTAYVATGSDTLELLVINVTNPASLTVGTSINMAGTVDATTIDGSGTTLVIGQGNTLRTATASTPLAPTLSGSVLASGTSIINDLAIDSSHNIAFAATNGTNQLQIFNISPLTTPTAYSTVNTGSGATLNGVAYNSTLDRAVGANSLLTTEFMVFRPN